MADIDLRGSWDGVYSSIEGAFGEGPLKLAAGAGAVLVVFAIGKWIWERRKGGGGGGNGGLGWTLLFGCLLVAPTVVIPMVLTMADWVANTVAGWVQSGTGA